MTKSMKVVLAAVALVFMAAIALVVAFILTATPAAAAELHRAHASRMSHWHEGQAKWWNETKILSGFAKPLAWGDGEYRGEKFQWFAFTNSDALVQFNVSVPLEKRDERRVIELHDSLKRSWSVVVSADGTWISASNDWMFKGCRQPNYDPCSSKAATDKYIRQLNRYMGRDMKFRVIGYL